MIINLPEIKPDNRRSESEFWRDFERDKAAIFVGLLDCLVSGLAHRDSVVLTEKPRMADVAIWVTACEQGYKPETTFIEAHTKNQLEAIELGIEASPVGTAIKELMTNRDEWKGTPSELHKQLESLVGQSQTESRAWPSSTRGLNGSIKRLMPSFRKIGIFIILGKSGDRFYRITKGTLQASKVSKPMAGAAYSTDTCRADSNPKCPPANPVTARVWADRAVKNDLPILADDVGRF